MKQATVRLLLILSLFTMVAEARPKLVFLLIIDQFRADYLERFRADFVPGGFARLLRQGAVFTNTYYDYSGTETAPGHATIATGANPATHGIIGNDWYDRSQKKIVPAVQDPATRLVGVDRSPGSSPRNLIGTALADEVRMAFDGKVVAVSIKDRAAILPGGKNPNAVFWLDEPTGKAVTSSYYMDRLPEWVERFNDEHSLISKVGQEWRALNAKPGDPPLGVIAKPGTRGGATLFASPFGNETVMAVARRALREYKLGQGQTTDFLSISLSSNDYVGHNFGPESPQVVDITRRTDRLLAAFFAELDRTVGAGNWVVAFTADHGVAPNPELLKKQRIDAGRFKGSEITDPMEAALRTAFGGTGDEKWVIAQDLPNIYLNHELVVNHRTTAEGAAQLACQATAGVPGVHACFTAGQLAAGRGPSWLGLRAANSYFSGRSGEITVIFSPFWVRDYPNLVANHGTVWNFDRHVPLILMGPGIKPGVYRAESSPTDLAVTLAALLGVNPPAVATGKILDVALTPVTGH